MRNALVRLSRSDSPSSLDITRLDPWGGGFLRAPEWLLLARFLASPAGPVSLHGDAGCFGDVGRKGRGREVLSSEKGT